MSKPVLVVSAHLDDGILGAGQFIAGRKGDVDILTIFSGVPSDPSLKTNYDVKSGFKNSQDAMVIRREEDIEACSILNATAYHTNMLDSQYTKNHENLSQVLTEFIDGRDYELILAPLGLRHPDHVAVSDAMITLELPNLYLYEDLPARVTHPELVFERLEDVDSLITGELELTFIGDGPIADKVRSLWCYRSQICKGDLNPYNLYVPERFWRV